MTTLDLHHDALESFVDCSNRGADKAILHDGLGQFSLISISLDTFPVCRTSSSRA